MTERQSFPTRRTVISPTGRHFFRVIKNSAHKALHPSSGDYTIQNALAAVQVEQTILMGRPSTSGEAETAEITTNGRSHLSQLRVSAKKAARPKGKKGDLFNGLAAIHLEQTRMLNRVGRFSDKEPVIKDDLLSSLELLEGSKGVS